MKVLIVSDTHGRHDGIEAAIEREKPFQMLIHLGDAEGYEDYIEALAECPIEAVAGNSDYFSGLPQEKELLVDNLRILITHGHYYCVSNGYERICQEGISRQMDIVMFGHTHRPVILEKDGIIVLNPGSLSFPRQRDGQRSYIVMEKSEGEPPTFEIKYVD